MGKVGIRALKQNASAVVAEAVAGEIVTITDRGRPVAQLGPVPSSRIEALIQADRARPARRRFSDLRAPARRRTGQPAMSSVLDAMREDDRR